jgi:hypothetical protein
MSNQQSKAIDILMYEYEAAEGRKDVDLLDSVLARLVFACSSSELPDIARASRFCVEREENMNSAYNSLQTGLFWYHTANDQQAAALKLRDAIAKGRQQKDYRTVYSPLNVLRLALLDLDRTAEATTVLREIEQMILDKRPFVVGDETAFLESALERGIEVQSVKMNAAALAPICRDPEFARRLKSLAASEG